MRKSDFCLCENKDTDQLCSYCIADQQLCFCFSDSTIFLLPKSEISSFQQSSVAAQTGLCQTCSETSKTSFLVSWLCQMMYDRHIPVRQFEFFGNIAQFRVYFEDILEILSCGGL